ncbi:MAG: alanine racemase [Xanthomonadales bacterium]|nr:Alanine racemase, biosynthetic [Xanthomonadales bacterium]MCC6594640.1 alanine racemase [Xanthomonadales bacterium]MCE7932257.1 alanine racemase [Xanthomonadales bacterium PRO6]
MRATTATIHLDALRHNLRKVRALAPKSKLMAVVKADGYGHGLERVAQALAGADAFGVATLADAERVRRAGLKHRVVLLSGFDEPSDLSAVRELGIDCVIHHESQLALLERLLPPGPLSLWIKLDTGMHRLGFDPGQARRVWERLRALPQVAELRWMTHFACADDGDRERSEAQMARFREAIGELPGERSLANSAAVQAFPMSHGDWIRPGGMLYGLSTFHRRSGRDLGLKPAMSLSTRLVSVQQLAAGEAVGYGATWTAAQPTRIGIAAVGYGDGYPRHAPAGTPVRVAGQSARVIGRVSMDLLAIDLAAAPAAEVGSDVLLWGPELPVEQVAEAAGTIGYELVCGVTRRVQFAEARAEPVSAAA